MQALEPLPLAAVVGEEASQLMLSVAEMKDGNRNWTLAADAEVSSLDKA